MSTTPETRTILAGLAMVGLLSSNRYEGAEQVAKDAVLYADALLAELAKPINSTQG